MNRFLFFTTIIASYLSQDNNVAAVTVQLNKQQNLRHGSTNTRREMLSSTDDINMNHTDLVMKPYYDSSSYDIFSIDARMNKKIKTGIRSMGTDSVSFITFSDKWIDFTGQCDLMLIKFPWNKFELQARTKIIPDHDNIATQTIVSMIALRIGDDIIEIDDSDITYKNGKLVNHEDFPLPLAGGSVKITYEVDEDYVAAVGSKQSIAHIHRIDLGTTYTKDRDIKISVVDHHIVVQLVGYLANTTGLLGTYTSDDIIDRTGTKKIWTTDFMQLGNEWQVTDQDSKLFHDIQLPQYPQKCIFPGDKEYNTLIMDADDHVQINDTVLLEKVDEVIISRNVSITAHDEVAVHLNETLIGNATDTEVIFVTDVDNITAHHGNLELTTTLDENATLVEEVEEDDKNQDYGEDIKEVDKKPNNKKKNDGFDDATTNTTTTTTETADHGDDIHVNETSTTNVTNGDLHMNTTTNEASTTNVTNGDLHTNTTTNTTTENHADMIEKNETTIVDNDHNKKTKVNTTKGSKTKKQKVETNKLSKPSSSKKQTTKQNLRR